MAPETDALHSLAESLCHTARWCYTRGWVPATSGNFSVRQGERVLVTASGLDKGTLTPAGLIEIDLEGLVGRGAGKPSGETGAHLGLYEARLTEIDLEGLVVSGAGKPSAETGLHLVLYKARPEAGVILHVHTIWNTLLSGIHAASGHVAIGGYELLKGLSDVDTHMHVEQ